MIDRPLGTHLRDDRRGDDHTVIDRDTAGRGPLTVDGQVVQEEAEPTEDLNVPVGQGKHGPPAGPKKPAAQVQLLGEELPEGASKLRGQV